MMITGTREGGTPEQLATLKGIVIAYKAGGDDATSYESEPLYYRHGDCVGVDSQFHDILLDVGVDFVYVCIHPPTDKKLAANRDDGATIYGDADYLVRNRKMVDYEDFVVVVPKVKPADGAKVTGGTWYTADYATTKKKNVLVIWPDGSCEKIGRTT